MISQPCKILRLDGHNQELHPDEALTLADARTPVVLGATLQVPELPLRAHARSPHPTNLLLRQVCYRIAIEAGQKAEVQHVMSNALAVAYHPQTDITEILGLPELPDKSVQIWSMCRDKYGVRLSGCFGCSFGSLVGASWSVLRGGKKHGTK